MPPVTQDVSVANVERTSFKLPLLSQLQFRPMGLPAEIRIMILRLLLKFSRVRGVSYGEVAQRPRIRAGVHLMQTCQTLHAEGAAILFGENVVYVSLSHHRDQYHMTDMFPEERLDLRTRLPVLGVCDAQSVGLSPSDTIDPDSKSGTNFRRLKTGFMDGKSNDDMTKLLCKFQSFEFDVQRTLGMNDEEPNKDLFEEVLFHACRVSREFLKDKTLIVSFNTDEQKSLLERSPHVLDGCKVLENTSVRVKTVELTPELREQLWSRRRPVQDTYKLWHAFQTSIVQNLMVIGDHHHGCADDYEDFEDEQIDRLEGLRITATRYDANDYAEKFRFVLRDAIEWKNNRWNRHIRQLEPKIERLHSGINTYKALVGEDLTNDMNISFNLEVLENAEQEEQ